MGDRKIQIRAEVVDKKPDQRELGEHTHGEYSMTCSTTTPTYCETCKLWVGDPYIGMIPVGVGIVLFEDFKERMCAEVARLTEQLAAVTAERDTAIADLTREQARHEQTLAERDRFEQQVDDLADALGVEEEWSNLHDRGAIALERAKSAIAEPGQE